MSRGFMTAHRMWDLKMIDPVTAIAGATKAFTMVKAMVEAGKSAEDR